MASPAEQVAAKAAKRKKERKVRPNGQPYSSDPKIRYQELSEDGKFGGELAKVHGQLGGRPRKVSAQEFVAEKAREEAEEIYAGLRAGLESGSVKENRESAKAILAFEEKYLVRQERERERRDSGDKDRVIDRLLDLLMGDTPAARALRDRMGVVTIPDADVVEDVRELAP